MDLNATDWEKVPYGENENDDDDVVVDDDDDVDDENDDDVDDNDDDDDVCDNIGGNYEEEEERRLWKRSRFQVQDVPKGKLGISCTTQGLKVSFPSIPDESRVSPESCSGLRETMSNLTEAQGRKDVAAVLKEAMGGHAQQIKCSNI